MKHLGPMVAVAGRHDLDCTSSPDSGKGTPSKGRSVHGPTLRTRRRMLQAGTVVLCIWVCGWALAFGKGPAVSTALVWPSDSGEQQLVVQQQLLTWQQAVRSMLVGQRAAAAGRPYAGFLPQAPPRIALLFLVRSHVPLEPVWREFFATAAQIEPVALPEPFVQLVASTQQQQQQRQQQEWQLRQELQQQRRLFAHGIYDDSQLVADRDAAVGLEVMAAVQQLEAAKAASRGSQEDWERWQGAPVALRQAVHLRATQRHELVLGEGQLAQEAQQQALRTRSMEAPLSMMSPVSTDGCKRDPEGVIAQQDLFSVYVHTMPGFFYRNTSIFSGYQIDRRVFVSWGQYTVAEAERRLIIDALTEPRNQRFVLVSETCTPLYPPHVFYLQLLSDTKSRVNACGKPEGVERWNAALYVPGMLTPQRWRKGAQWKMLLRDHAQIVAADRQLALRFERECYSYFPPVMVRPPYVVAQNRTWVHRSCISDEHYIPTLLAVHGKDEETTCADALTTADWVPGLWSPKVHHGGEVDVDLLHRLRKQRATDIDCNAADALASATTMFRRRGASTTLAGHPLPGSAQRTALRHRRQGEQQLEQQGQQQQQQPRQEYKFASMTTTCFLLARKFAPDAAPMLLQLGANCQLGTALSPACLPA